MISNIGTSYKDETGDDNISNIQRIGEGSGNWRISMFENTHGYWKHPSK